MAQIDITTLNDLVGDLTNYVESNCREKIYAKSAQGLISKLNADFSKSDIALSDEKYTQFTEAKKGFVDFEMSQLFGASANCNDKINNSIAKLKSLAESINKSKKVEPIKDSKVVR